MTYDIDEHAFYNTFGQEVVDVVFLEDVYKAANRYEALPSIDNAPVLSMGQQHLVI